MSSRETRLAIRIERGNVGFQCRDSGRHLKPRVAVIPRRVAGQCESARLAVIGEALRGVEESNAVCDYVVRGTDVSGVAAAEFESISVALEVGEAPAMVFVSVCSSKMKLEKQIPVEPVSPRNRILDRETRLELP